MAIKRVSRIEKTAYHEAGHAIACHFLRIGYRYVTIEPKEDAWGRVVHRPFPKSFQPDIIDVGDNKLRLRIERLIMVSFAGQATELALKGGKATENIIYNTQDGKNAIDVALFLTEEEKELNAFLKWLWMRTFNWIKNPLYWLAVEELVKELLIKHKLSAREVKGIINNTIQGVGKGKYKC